MFFLQQFFHRIINSRLETNFTHNVLNQSISKKRRYKRRKCAQAHYVQQRAALDSNIMSITIARYAISNIPAYSTCPHYNFWNDIDW